MTAPQLESVDEHQYRLSGELTFGTVVGLLGESQALFRHGANFTLNLEGVTHSDSAGLALLIEWLRLARQNSVVVDFHNIPSQMLALARVSGVDQMVTPIARADSANSNVN